MSRIADLMVERVLNRRVRWNTSEEEILPPPEWMDEATILGTFSMVGMQTRRRLLLKDTSMNVLGLLESPSAVARDYLTVTYKRGPAIKHEQTEALKQTKTPMPLFIKPTEFKNGYYVDIAAAYWNIMLKIGWNVDYWPGRWIAPGRAPDDFPYPEHKIARNCLVSSGIVSTVPVWTPKTGMIQLHTGNPLANMQLYGLINDVLNCIAADAVDAGAVYVATDGYIAPDEESMRKIIMRVADWGLVARIKYQGSGYVNAPGSYKVGLDRTRVLQPRPIPVNNIYKRPYHKWLREAFSAQ